MKIYVHCYHCGYSTEGKVKDYCSNCQREMDTVVEPCDKIEKGDGFLSNQKNNPIEIEHKSLKPVDNSSFRRYCPVCDVGTLLVRRRSLSLKITASEKCCYCGQKFIYSDVKELRDKDGVDLFS